MTTAAAAAATAPTAKGFDRFKIEWLLVADLVPHPKVQRPFNAKWAQQIAAEFDPDKFRPLDVTPRGNKYLVFAGQHRLAAARSALGENQRVPCHVHNDVPIEHMAAICLGVDNMLHWNILDRWSVRVTAKEDVPVKIEGILARHGLHVGKNPTPGVVRAVASLETVYHKNGGEPALDRTLRILGGAYGSGKEAKDAFDGILVRGVGLLVHRFGEKLDDEELIRKLAKHSGPHRMIGTAKDFAKTTGVSTMRAVAERILVVYNERRRADRLEL